MKLLYFLLKPGSVFLLACLVLGGLGFYYDNNMMFAIGTMFGLSSIVCSAMYIFRGM